MAVGFAQHPGCCSSVVVNGRSVSTLALLLSNVLLPPYILYISMPCCSQHLLCALRLRGCLTHKDVAVRYLLRSSTLASIFICYEQYVRYHQVPDKRLICSHGQLRSVPPTFGFALVLQIAFCSQSVCTWPIRNTTPTNRLANVGLVTLSGGDGQHCRVAAGPSPQR